MNIFQNKYHKELESIYARIENIGEELTQYTQECKNKTIQYGNVYNADINQINAVKLIELRKTVRTLQKFLIKIGHQTNEITISEMKNDVLWNLNINFDIAQNFQNELQEIVHKDNKLSKNEDLLKIFGVPIATSSVATLASVTFMPFFSSTLPVAMVVAPVMSLVGNLFERFNQKELIIAIEKAFGAVEENIRLYKLETGKNLLQIKDATIISKAYKEMMVGVIDCIDCVIIPELSAVYAFLCASTFKDSIIAEEIPESITPASYQSFSSSIYQRHSLFVENTINYYHLIESMFTNDHLTKYIEDYSTGMLQNETKFSCEKVHDLSKELSLQAEELKKLAIFKEK